MKITFHIGAHRTDEDRLMRALIRNNQRLAAEGIFIPGPSKFRNILRDVPQRLKGEPADPETLDLVLDTILDTTEAAHIVLCHESFTCAAVNIMADGGYYARAGTKCAWLRNTFPGHEVGFALGIRNPATQVPAVFGALSGVRAAEFMAGLDPLALRWSAAVAGILARNPGCPLIVWCNEDTPMIWPEVMRRVSGTRAGDELRGGYDILGQIMEPEGMRRLRTYLGTHPPQNEVQRRRILAAFLDKYARDEEIEEDIDFPGWTAEVVEAMTEAYEADIDRLQAMPGVTFLAP
jgi:hypothetical protein